MLTPRFILSQTKTEIILKVHAPYANVAETEIYVHENDVRFHSSPYYLRLNLPGWVEENDGSRAVFDADSGDFIIRLGKAVPGEHFPDLDMITKLLAPKQSSTKIAPEISVVTAVPTDCSQSDSEDEEMQWFLEQVPEAEDDSELNNKISYGFANSYNSVFKKIENHSLQFYYPQYFFLLVSLSEENIDVLKDLPNKEYIMDSSEKTYCYLGIIDLVFAYAYDQRTTDGEGTEPVKPSQSSDSETFPLIIDPVVEKVPALLYGSEWVFSYICGERSKNISVVGIASSSSGARGLVLGLGGGDWELVAYGRMGERIFKEGEEGGGCYPGRGRLGRGRDKGCMRRLRVLGSLILRQLKVVARSLDIR
ncbi:hypothetical protein J437_LFUL012926 [Ladona fulva]|uniref:Protein SHQ1 homolog n=1 Tax=Ladona fulva TaxID=123851 RepID=A0A8K0KC49_LADFU|nr:hypothetical protein J437_LFUL012926 [Ladona fulva]